MGLDFIWFRGFGFWLQGLKQTKRGDFGHEKSLLCETQQPPLTRTKDNGLGLRAFWG